MFHELADDANREVWVVGSRDTATSAAASHRAWMLMHGLQKLKEALECAANALELLADALAAVLSKISTLQKLQISQTDATLLALVEQVRNGWY